MSDEAWRYWHIRWDGGRWNSAYREGWPTSKTEERELLRNSWKIIIYSPTLIVAMSGDLMLIERPDG